MQATTDRDMEREMDEIVDGAAFDEWRHLRNLAERKGFLIARSGEALTTTEQTLGFGGFENDDDPMMEWTYSAYHEDAEEAGTTMELPALVAFLQAQPDVPEED